MHMFWLGFYRLVLWPLLRTLFRGLGFFNAKVRRGLEMRAVTGKGKKPWLSFERATRPVWIHCASFEFEYAKPVITAIKAREPNAKILVTYFSPTVAKAASQFPGVDFACPSPWEDRESVREFIKYHTPQMLLIARTDTWPEMLAQARAASIPTLLFSATIAPTSGRAKGIGAWMSKAVFADLTQIFCVDEADRQVFSALGCGPKTRVAGDTRYDQVQARLSATKPLKEALFSNTSDVLVAGSTWEQDEAVLIEAASEMKADPLSWILVPHEPTESHLNELEAKLAERGLSSVRYSRADTWDGRQILLIDQLGILAELYLKGRFAFVGGSFKKTVHSVMEPLAAGCLTFVGPLHENNREALEFKVIRVQPEVELTCVQVVQDAQDLVQTLRMALRSLSSEGSARIKDEIRARSGKSDLVAKWALERWSLS